MTTPVVRTAKKQLNAEVHYLTKIQYAGLLESNPYIDKLHLLDKNLKKIIRDLRSENFDLVIDLHHNLRSFRVKRALNIPAKSFYKANIEKWLMVNFKINKLPENHIVDRYMDTLSSYDIVNDGQGLDFFYDENSISEIPGLPDQYLVISIGGAHRTKQLPFTKLNDIIQNIKRPIVLIGGADVVELGTALKKSNPQLIDLTGKINLNASAWLIKNSVGMITGDTGTMHIGAAFGTQMFVIWGNTIPGFGMYPYYDDGPSRHINFEVHLPCRPCSKTGHSICPKGHFKCMSDQDFTKISESSEKFFHF